MTLKSITHHLFVKSDNASLISQIARFGIIGFLSFCIDVGIFVFLERVLNLHYIFAALISFVTAATFGWYGNSKWVFLSSKIANAKIEILVFMLLAFIGLGINELALWIGIEKLMLDSIVTKIGVTILVAVWNFIFRKLILYR